MKDQHSDFSINFVFKTERVLISLQEYFKYPRSDAYFKYSSDISEDRIFNKKTTIYLKLLISK